MTTAPVAILGRSPATAHLVNDSQAAEVWGVGVVYKYYEPGPQSPPLTRIYEIHPQWMLADPLYDEEHFEHLMAGPHPYEIICAPKVSPLTEKYYEGWFGSLKLLRDWVKGNLREIPNSRPYPLGAALALQHGIKRVDTPNRFLTNSVDYAIAHAILEGRERIELYGVDLDTKTEYAYQRPGVSFWLGLAAGRGIEIRLPEETPMLRAKLYAVELGGQMVPRQKLEFLRGKWTDEIFQGEAMLNHIKGKLEARLIDMEARPEDEKLVADVTGLQKEFTQNMRMLDRVVGARQAVQMMIEECDLQEPSYEISEVTEISLG